MNGFRPLFERFARFLGRIFSAALARAPTICNLRMQGDRRHEEFVDAIARLEGVLERVEARATDVQHELTRIESKLARLEAGTADFRRLPGELSSIRHRLAEVAAAAAQRSRDEQDADQPARNEIAQLSEDHWVRLLGSSIVHFSSGNADYALRPPAEIKKVRALVEGVSALKPTHIAFFRCEDPCLPSFLLPGIERADVCSLECSPAFSATVRHAVARDGRVREWDGFEAWRASIRDLAAEHREPRPRALVVTQVNDRNDLLERLARLTSVRSFMTFTCYVPHATSAAADLCAEGFPEQLAYQLNRDSLVAASFDPASSRWRYFSSSAWNGRAETLLEGPFENFTSVGLSMQAEGCA